MKKLFPLLTALVLFSSVASPVFAGTTNIYVGDWGTTNGGASVTGANTFGTVGWHAIIPAPNNPPYEGIYAASAPYDINTGQSLPANTVYYTFLAAGQNGMLYTTDSDGTGGGGDQAFADIDPTKYTNLTLSVEANNTGTAASNYFAVLVGGNWYVSTTLLIATNSAGAFANASIPYTNLASAWRNLTLNANSVTIGPTPGANLTGSITGIGIVEVGPGGWNYNEVIVSALGNGGGVTTVPASILSPPISQTEFVGGGTSFAVQAGGTVPVTYIWESNGVPLANGGRVSGASTSTLTITNLNANDASVTYSVVVSNSAGSATNSAFTLTVNPVPADYLYAETVPYIGPASAGNLPVSTIGWVSAIPDGNTRIYAAGGGQGAVYAYEATAMTTAFYTTVTNDTGNSGLPFHAINPADYPQVAFEVSLSPNSVVNDVLAYFAVQMNGTTWYVASTNIQENLATTGVFETQQMQFTTSASAWDALTITGTGATIGSQASSPLTGTITGVGIVFVHHGGGGDFNWDQFLVTTDVVGAVPPSIGLAGTPNSQTVYAGGGVSFGVATANGGTSPFTYGWTLNGVPLVDGPRVSGAHTPVVTISHLSTNDVGPNGTVSVIAYVTNSAGYDESDNWADTTLTVVNPPVGLIYSESFPFVGPASGNYSVGTVGWAESVSGSPASLYQRIGSDGAIFAYQGAIGTGVYYVDTQTDTNQAGLPFPNISIASSSNLNLSVDIAPTFNSANVTAYFLVQVNGNAWYIASNPIPVPVGDTGTFTTYNLPFNPAKANWRNITVTGSGALLGSGATTDLSGTLTGAGLVFLYTSSGGNDNFDNFTITGSGLGGVNVSSPTNGNLMLTWVGNPSVVLQSTTNLTTPNWQTVPNSANADSITVPTTGQQKYFRLIQQ